MGAPAKIGAVSIRRSLPAQKGWGTMEGWSCPCKTGGFMVAESPALS